MEKEESNFISEAIQDEEAIRKAKKEKERGDLLHNILNGPQSSGGKKEKTFFVDYPC